MTPAGQIEPEDPAAPHPAIFALLLLPSGASGGFVSVTLVYLLSRQGISAQAIAGALALGISMQVWKFLWAPLVDVVFRYRGWYLGTALPLAAVVAASGLIHITPKVLPVVALLLVVLGVLSSFGAIAADGLIAHSTTTATKGRAGGWVQAGYLGGGGLGGGGGLWLAVHTHAWIASLSVGLVCVAAALTVLAIREPVHAHRHASYFKTIAALGGEVWTLVRTRLGIMAVFLLILPLGTAAAGNLFPALARDWGASAGTVALVTGALSGLVCIPGSLAGGYLGDMIDRKSVYVLGGGLMAMCAVGMATAPKTPLAYVVFTLLYALSTGVVWGAYSAVVYEAAGRGAAAMKCNLLSSLCNIPIAVMVAVDGWAQTRWGASAMLAMEAAIGAVAILVFVAVRLATAARPAPALAPAAIAQNSR